MINDYTTLQSAVARWLARADLTASIPDFIQLAETRINQDLRTQNQQVKVSGTTSGLQITLPTDFRQVESFIATIGGVDFPLRPESPIQSANADMRSTPKGFWISGNTLNLIGSQDVSYSMVYFAGVPSLSASNPQNWLILSAPNVYLYASLLESAPFIRDDDRINIWGSAYLNAMNALKTQDEFARYSPSPRQRVDFATP